MQQKLPSLTGHFSGHTELRLQQNTSTSMQLLKGNLVANSRALSSGVGARIYKDGFWGFASTPQWNQASIQSVIDSAASNASFLSSKGKRRVGKLQLTPTVQEHVFSSKKMPLSQKEIVAFTQELDTYITKNYPGLSSRSISMRSLDMEKRVETSYGSKFHSLTPRTHIYIVLTVEKDGKPIELKKVIGGLGHFADNFTEPQALYSTIDELYAQLQQKRDGDYVTAGMHDLILAPDLAGILAHEAVGHTVEADIVQGGSIAAERMNQTVASPLVSLVDFAHTAFGKICPVPVHVDDEGTEAKDCVVIDKGILKSFMHNKESADRFGVNPTGNARAWEFKDEPLIRMRNTAILPGDSKLQEMIASIENGYYLMNPANGQADATSEFMFAVEMGYEIKNGKLGRAIRDTTISGIAFNMLKTISMVSDDMKWESGGFCGKKQIIPVGMGGPAIKCRANLGGK